MDGILHMIVLCDFCYWKICIVDPCVVGGGGGSVNASVLFA